MKKVVFAMCGAVVLSLHFGGRADGAPFELKPTDTDCTSNINKDFKGAELLAILSGCFGATAPLELLYKAEVPKTLEESVKEEGSFASSYEAIFSQTALDPQNALIVNGGSTYMDCSACYLVVKDGNQTPAVYFFDISLWNGTDDLKLTGFWPYQGAISNVAIWGQAVSVPEPASLMLFGAALGLISLRRRRLA